MDNLFDGDDPAKVLEGRTGSEENTRETQGSTAQESDSGSESEPNSEKSSSSAKRVKRHRTTWTEKDSRRLIATIKDLQIVEHLEDKKCKKKHFYENISAKLSKSDPPLARSAEQIETHWKVLKKLFNETKLLIAESGDGATKFNLYHDMNNLIDGVDWPMFMEEEFESKVKVDVQEPAQESDSDSKGESEQNSEKSSEKRVKRHRTTWTESESRRLITIIKDLKIIDRLEDRKCKKKYFYEHISQKLGQLNPPLVRSAEQIETHWKVLRKLFKEANLLSDERPNKFNLYDDMNNLIGGRRPMSKTLERAIESEEDNTMEIQGSDFLTSSPNRQSLMRVVCLVCNTEREIDRGNDKSLENDKEKKFALKNLWAIFCKYFYLTPSRWEDISSFYSRIEEFPFCSNCLKKVNSLLDYDGQLTSILLKIEGITSNLTAFLLQSSKAASNQVISCVEEDNIVTLNKNVHNRIGSLRTQIAQRYSSRGSDFPKPFVYNDKWEFTQVGDYYKCCTCNVVKRSVYEMSTHVKEAHDDDGQKNLDKRPASSTKNNISESSESTTTIAAKKAKLKDYSKTPKPVQASPIPPKAATNYRPILPAPVVTVKEEDNNPVINTGSSFKIPAPPPPGPNSNLVHLVNFRVEMHNGAAEVDGQLDTFKADPLECFYDESEEAEDYPMDEHEFEQQQPPPQPIVHHKESQSSIRKISTAMSKTASSIVKEKSKSTPASKAKSASSLMPLRPKFGLPIFKSQQQQPPAPAAKKDDLRTVLEKEPEEFVLRVRCELCDVGFRHTENFLAHMETFHPANKPILSTTSISDPPAAKPHRKMIMINQPNNVNVNVNNNNNNNPSVPSALARVASSSSGSGSSSKASPSRVIIRPSSSKSASSSSNGSSSNSKVRLMPAPISKQPDAPFSCLVRNCSKSFYSEIGLEMHMDSHNTLLNCAQCSEVFFISTDLRNHVKTAHPVSRS